jgi:hypothetical protein
VPPELWENRGEIQAAQKHKLPELIMAGRRRFNALFVQASAESKYKRYTLICQAC